MVKVKPCYNAYMTQTPEMFPPIGFGTGQLQGAEAEQAVRWALQHDYRLIDTGAIYGNEHAVGRAIASSNIDREDILVVTKGAHESEEHGYTQILEQFDTSLQRLGLDYIDYYLVHWPSHPQLRVETWRAMETIQKNRRAQYIGVSNYSVRHLDELEDAQLMRPAVNEIELHPYIFSEQRHLIETCKNRRIPILGYATFANGQGDTDEVVERIAAKCHKTPRQILTRWAMQHSVVPLVRSRSEAHIIENRAVEDFAINDDDMRLLDGLHGTREFQDPALLP